MGSAIYAHTTIVSSSYRISHGLRSYNMTSIKGWRKHSRHNSDLKTDNNSAIRHESHSKMLQNHIHSDNEDEVKSIIIMNSTSNQNPSINHAHIVTLLEIFHSRMTNKRPANKNRSYTTSIKLQKHTIAISIYMRKNRDNRIIHSTSMVDINCKNQNRDHKKHRERPTWQNSNALRRYNDNNIYK